MSTATAERFEQFVANPPRALWVLSVPIMVGMAIQTLYMVVDMMFVGRISGDALTALAFNMPLLFMAMGATFGVGTGVTALVAQAVGGQSRDDATRVGQHALAIGVAMLVIFMTPGLLWGQEMLVALGVPPELLGASWSYFRVIVLGFPFMVLAVFLRSILSGEGEVKLPVAIQIAATLLNIVLDPIFIFVLDMGVTGAAVATVVAQAVTTAALAYLLLARGTTFVQLRGRPFAIDGKTIARIVAVGAPASLSFMVMSVGGAAYNRILIEFTPAAVAAQQVGMRLDHVTVLPMAAIASSLVTLVGMFYGAHRNDLVRRVVGYAFTRAIVIAASISIVMYFTAPWIVGIFTTDAEIRSLSTIYLRILVFSYPFMAISMLTGRVLQGLGRGVPLLVLTSSRVLLIGVPLSAFFVYVMHYPVYSVWLAVLAGTVGTAALAVALLLTGMRRIARETAPDAAEPGAAAA